MTHDELLIEINRRLDVALYNGDAQSIHALRAVVELHKPAFAVVDGVKGAQWCYQCADQRGYAKYPCPTIQAIEKELG
jgi:hypothetical protein